MSDENKDLEENRPDSIAGRAIFLAIATTIISAIVLYFSPYSIGWSLPCGTLAGALPFIWKIFSSE